MRTEFTRTLATSTIKPCTITVKDGKPEITELEAVTVAGKVSEKEALKAVQKKYGKSSNIAIASIEVVEDLYSISLEDFMKYATKKTANKDAKKEKESK